MSQGPKSGLIQELELEQELELKIDDCVVSAMYVCMPKYKR